METTRQLDIGCFVRVVRQEEGALLLIGSGVVIAPHLILTCAHDLGTSPAGLYVAPLDGGMSKKAAAVHVHSGFDEDDRLSDKDIALVELARPLKLTTSPPSLRVLGKGLASLDFHSLGFPDYFARKGTPARRKQLDGRVMLGSGEETDLFELRLEQRPPESNRAVSKGLKGMSGSAVVTARGGHVVGVFVAYEDAKETAWAVGLGSLRDPALAEPLARHGVDLIDMTEEEARADEPLEVVPHQRYLASLTGLESHLRSEMLEFIAPWADDPAHPRRILDRLARGEHVMVSGPAGSGKTRLCLETAQAAANRGWAVYHVPASGLPVEKLAHDAARAAERRVLLVCGQPERDIDLDPHAVARQAALVGGSGGKTVVVLTAAPDGGSGSRLPGDARFKLVPAPLGDSHLRTVTDAIIAQVGGLNRLEEDVFASARTACGLRPGLALRIAPAFAFDSDRKPIGVRKSGRQGGSELSRWIARHLADDGLTAGEGGDPDRVGLAAGAAMAMMVAPQPRKRVQRAVGHLFQHAGSPEKADALVGLLVSRGWLEEHDGSAHPLHPVIADEMLARALLAPDGEALSTTAEWIFQAALDDPVSARRLIDGIRRLVDAYPHEGLKSLLKAKCHDWVEQHGRAIGVLAVAFEAQRGDEVGLIPAMLEGPPWYAIASDHLKTLSHQYLSSETDPAVGRSRLEASLAALPKPAQIPADWRTLAADLLSGDLGAPDGPLLAAALGRRSPDQQWARQVRDTAIRWTEDHTDAAAPVLGALIRDRSLPKPDLHLVVERALDWISRHDGPGGTRVLAPLIINKKLTPRQRDDVLSAARDWLRRNSRTEDAKFVLRALLKDPVRRENHFREALPFAFEWLEANGDSSASWSVASHVCNRDAVAAWLPHLLPWLETHAIEPVIRSVLVRTLQIRSKHLELDEERKMVRCGVAWLRANPDDWAVPEVCGALAGHARRPGLEGKQRKYRQNQAVTSEQADEVLISVSRWIGGFGSRNINTSVVLALLGYYHAGREPTVQFSRDALDWLGHPRPVDDARKVLSLLVRRGAFDEESADEAAERVAKELESFPEFVKDTRLQAGIFRLFKKFPGAVRAPVREAFAAAAIGVAEDDDGAAEPPSIPPFDVLQHLLHIGGFEPGRRRQICLSGLRWLESNSAQDDADKIIRRLLDEPGWRGAEIQSLIDHAFEWLHRWIDAGKASPDHEGPSNVLSRLVRRPELRRADVMTALEMAERWMSGKGKRKWAAHRRIAEAFLERQDLTPDEEARYLSILLRTARSSTEWREQLLQALERGLVWLRDHADLPTASNVIGPALWRARDQGELEWDRTAVFAAAERWLRRYQRLGRAHYVLKPLLLLDREAALPDDFQNLVPFTLAYLESHAEDWYAREVFRLVCRREDLSDAQRTALVDIARVWLENRSADPEASHVLQALVRLSLTDAQLEFVLEASLAWATNMLDIIERRYESGVTKLEYHRKYEPRYLLAKLLAREGLTEAGHSRVLGVALRTHRVKPLNTEPFDWELEPDSERVAGDEPLLRHAIEHLDGMDEVVEIGPVLAEAHAFRLPAETWTAVRERSLRWLEIHASAETAGEVYFQLARTMGVSSFRASRVLPRALAWLEIHGGKRSTRTLLWSLLRRELTADQVADLLPFAEPELTDFSLTTAQSRLLASVIAQPHTPAEVAEPLVRTAIEALEYDDGRGDAARWALIDGLTRCRHLNPAQRRRVIAFVVQWGGRPKTERRAAKLFNRCLDMEGLSGAEREQLLGAVVAWADTRAMDFTAWPVIAGIGAFLEREGAVGDGRARRVEKLILTAAGQAATNPEGGVLFADVVSLRWCGDEAQRTLLSGALEWFGEHYLKSRAGAVALALWPLGLKSAERRRLVQLAALWIQEHSSAPQANELVDAIRTSAMYASLPFRTRGILDEIHARTDDASLDPSEDDADEEAWGVV